MGDSKKAFQGECLSLAAQLERYAKLDGTLPGVRAAMMESVTALRLAAKPADEGVIARPLSEWHEDMGPVLWWKFPITEPPWCGTPLDDGKILTLDAQITVHDFNSEPQGGMLKFRCGGWPGYHTHFTPLPALPGEPKPLTTILNDWDGPR